MKVVYRGLVLAVVSCLFSVAGCAAWSPAPQFSQPYFQVEAGEAQALHVLAKKQEALAQGCAEHNSCDYSYFIRALLGLYESRRNCARHISEQGPPVFWPRHEAIAPPLLLQGNMAAKIEGQETMRCNLPEKKDRTRPPRQGLCTQPSY